jgi:hypothetical protein
MMVGVVFAQPVVAEKALPQGLYISPGIIKSNVPIESLEKTETITIKNTYVTPQQFSLELRPIDQYKNTVDIANDLPANIKDNLSLDQTTIALESNKSINVTLRIKNSESLPPGASYFAVVVRNVTAEPAAQKVTIQSAVSVKVFVIKEKGTIRKLQLIKAALPKISIGVPKKMTLELKNTGNIPVVMHGVVSISKGKTVYASSTINEKSDTVLPSQSAMYSSSFKKGAKVTFPGVYSVKGEIKSDQQDIAAYEYRTKGILILPSWCVVVLIVLLGYFSRKYWHLWQLRKPKSHLDKVHSLRRNSRPTGRRDSTK